MPNDPADLRLKVLLNEQNLLRNRISTTIENNNRYLVITFTMLTAFVSWGIKENIEEIFVFFPFLLLSILALANSMNFMSMTLGAFVIQIENKINSEIGEELLQWSNKCGQYVHNHKVLLIFYIIVFIWFLSLMSYCTVRAYGYFNAIAPEIYGKLFFGLYATLLGSITFYLIKKSYDLPKVQKEVTMDLGIQKIK